MRPQWPHLDQETSGLPNGAGEIEGAGDTSWRLKMRVWKIKIELQNSFFGVLVLSIYGSFSASRMFRSNIYLSQKNKRLGSLNQRQWTFCLDSRSQWLPLGWWEELEGWSRNEVLWVDRVIHDLYVRVTQSVFLWEVWNPLKTKGQTGSTSISSQR